MPSITYAPSTSAGTSPLSRSHAQSKILPQAVPGRMRVNAAWSSSANGVGSGERTIDTSSGATVV